MNQTDLSRLDTHWRTARKLLTTAQHRGREFVAATICLGWQLHNIKTELGFTHGNNQHSSGRSAHGEQSRTWKDWVEAELDLSRASADRAIQYFQGFQARLSKRLVNSIQVIDDVGGQDPARPEELIATLANPPATFTDKERASIQKAVEVAADGASLGSFLVDLRLAKGSNFDGPGGSGAGEDDDPPEPDEHQKAEQLAFAFFHPTLELGRLRAAPDFERRLQTLPLVTDDPDRPCLVRLEGDLDGLLREVRHVLKQKRRA